MAEIDSSQYSAKLPRRAYDMPVWQGAYVFSVTLTDGLVLRGNVTHMPDGYTWNSGLGVKRSLYIENGLYTLSDKRIKMDSLCDLSLLEEIELP